MRSIYRNIGKRIKFYRKQKGISQLELANLLNVTQAYIHQLEKGDIRINIETLLKIADILDVPAYMLAPELFKDKEDVNKFPKSFTIEDIVEWFKTLPPKEKKEMLSRFIQLV